MVHLLLSITDAKEQAVLQQSAALTLSRLARLPRSEGFIGAQPGLLRKLLTMLAAPTAVAAAAAAAATKKADPGGPRAMLQTKPADAAQASSRLAGTILCALSVVCEKSSMFRSAHTPSLVGCRAYKLAGARSPLLHFGAEGSLCCLSAQQGASNQQRLAVEPQALSTLLRLCVPSSDLALQRATACVLANIAASSATHQTLIGARPPIVATLIVQLRATADDVS
eukprot:SAG11_NODE_855_length_6868_cov_3.086128_8_plen_225_part_00